MHSLVRQVRFNLNPFLAELGEGDNSHSGKPAGTGLAIYFSLRIELCSNPDPDTGFVVNVVEIDRIVRTLVVPVFDDLIARSFKNSRHIGLDKLGQMLIISKNILTEYFDDIKIKDVMVDLNPARKFGLRNFEKDKDMFYYAEKFEFAAMHKLWNEKFNDDDNYKMFGKCANPTGHGHNYTAEFCVVSQNDKVDDFETGSYQQIINREFVDVVDHKNLNADVKYFAQNNPTVENIAKFAYDKLKGKFGSANLEKVTIWETERTCCSYSE